jgi:hypothetical protein
MEEEPRKTINLGRLEKALKIDGLQVDLGDDGCSVQVYIPGELSYSQTSITFGTLELGAVPIASLKIKKTNGGLIGEVEMPDGRDLTDWVGVRRGFGDTTKILKKYELLAKRLDYAGVGVKVMRMGEYPLEIPHKRATIPRV